MDGRLVVILSAFAFVSWPVFFFSLHLTPSEHVFYVFGFENYLSKGY